MCGGSFEIWASFHLPLHVYAVCTVLQEASSLANDTASAWIGILKVLEILAMTIKDSALVWIQMSLNSIDNATVLSQFSYAIHSFVAS